jgi:hypothetical protein
MNAPVSAIATETAQIEAALDALLSASIRANRDPVLLPHRGAMPVGVVMGDLLKRLQSWTQAQRDAGELLARPVWEVTRMGVTTLGRRLHEIGGARLMQEVCDRVAALDPANHAHRLDIMEKRWDGIGEWLA